jgi:hypothetical protein
MVSIVEWQSLLDDVRNGFSSRMSHVVGESLFLYTGVGPEMCSPTLDILKLHLKRGG